MLACVRCCGWLRSIERAGGTTCLVPIAIAMLLCSVLSSHVSLGAAYERLTPCLRACDAVRSELLQRQLPRMGRRRLRSELLKNQLPPVLYENHRQYAKRDDTDWIKIESVKNET